MRASSINGDLYPPLLAVLTPMNAFKSRSVGRRQRRIPSILMICALAKILTPIIKRLSITMICFFSRTEAKDYAMHRHHFLSNRSTGVKTVRVSSPYGIPIPLIEPLKISSINDGVLSLCERDKTVGCVKRLDNLVPFHGA